MLLMPDKRGSQALSGISLSGVDGFARIQMLVTI